MKATYDSIKKVNYVGPYKHDVFMLRSGTPHKGASPHLLPRQPPALPITALHPLVDFHPKNRHGQGLEADGARRCPVEEVGGQALNHHSDFHRTL